MSPTKERNGFRHGLREPTLALTLRLRNPDRVDLPGLDRRLTKALDLAIEPEPSARPRPRDQAIAAALAWRVLLVARALRQAGRVPVFDAGRILQVRPLPKPSGECEIRVAVPVLDRAPGDATRLACRLGIEFLVWALLPRSDPGELERLYEKAHRSLVLPLQGATGSGISTLPILRAAHQLGIPFRHVGGGAYQLGWGVRARLLQRSAVEGDSAIGGQLSTRKDLSAGILRAAGLPAAVHRIVTSEDQALQAAQAFGWPVVVKPSDLDRSEGVTVGIDTQEKLLEGFRAARALSANVLVEREVPGICYRLLIANGAFLYAISRRPVSVTGDGRRSIAALLAARAEDQVGRPHWRRVKAVTLDAPTLGSLASQGMTPDAIPAAGQKVTLRAIESSEWGGDIDDVTDQVHPENVDIAVRAARLFGLRNAGVDLLSSDISRPWHANGAILNELNYAPYFGGNEFARKRLPQFLASFIEQDGRIPVEVFVGAEDALAQGRARQREGGLPRHLTSHTQALDPVGEPMTIAGEGAYDRTVALLMNRDVRAVVLVLQTDEFLRTGLPVDRVDSVRDCGGVLRGEDGLTTLPTADRESLLRLLARHTA